MLALRELQQAFGAAMLRAEDDAICAAIVADSFDAAERLRVYRNTCRATLVATLRMSYPAVERLVGPDFFDETAERFAALHPPRSGYLNDYGGEFADFLAAFDPASSLAYLPDVARFEWALSVAANAPDLPVLDAGALATVDPQDHASLRFEPHPSVTLLALAFPADRIADAVLSGDDDAIGRVDPSSGHVWLVVHRGANGVQAQRLDPEGFRFVAGLCGRQTLGSLLERAPPGAPALLAEQLAHGRLGAFRVDAQR